MEAPVKKACLAQVAFPAIQFAVFTLIAYIGVYWFDNYDHKFDQAAAFKLYCYLIAFVTAFTTALYSITFLLNVHSIWNRLHVSYWLPLSIPIAVCALIQVGLFFPFEKLGTVGALLWLFLIPPALAWFTLKFIADEPSLETT